MLNLKGRVASMAGMLCLVALSSSAAAGQAEGTLTPRAPDRQPVSSSPLWLTLQELSVGTTLRLTRTDGSEVTGRLIEIGADTLVVERQRDGLSIRQTIGRSNVLSVDVVAMPVEAPASATSFRGPATSFDDLRHILRSGEEVIVTHANGKRTREIVRSVNESWLNVHSKSVFAHRALGPSRRLGESSVTAVKRVDSLKNGFFFGLGIGAGFGIVECTRPSSSQACAMTSYVPVMTTALLGMTAGVLVDSVIRKAIYRAPAGRSELSLSPLLGAKSTGVSLSVRF